MDISLELKGLPCLNKVYLLTYLLTYLRTFSDGGLGRISSVKVL